MRRTQLCSAHPPAHQRAPRVAFVAGLSRVVAPAPPATTPRRAPSSSSVAISAPHARRAQVVAEVGASSSTATLSSQLGASGERDADEGDDSNSPIRHRYRHTEESRRKISLANKGNVPWNKGLKHSEETRRKISAATRAAMTAPEVRKKLRAIATGRKHSEETKLKIRRSVRFGKRLYSGSTTGRKPRDPVPFVFSKQLVAQLDSKISKRYRAEFLLETADGGTRRPKRPMSKETRAKLSTRIKAMWEDPNYRDKVHQGIKARAMKKIGKGPLSEKHKESIRQSLLKRHATLRAEQSTNGESPGSPRRPRSKLEDPTAGTKLSSSNMSESSLREKQERIRNTTRIMERVEEESRIARKEKYRKQASRAKRAEARAKVDAEREAQQMREIDQALLQSLASAGQLPPLSHDCALLETPEFMQTSVGDASLFLTDADASMPVFASQHLGIDQSDELEDPLLCTSEHTRLSPSTTRTDVRINEVFIGAEEHLDDGESFPLPQVSQTLSPSLSGMASEAANANDNLLDTAFDDTEQLGKNSMSSIGTLGENRAEEFEADDSSAFQRPRLLPEAFSNDNADALDGDSRPNVDIGEFKGRHLISESFEYDDNSDSLDVDDEPGLYESLDSLQDSDDIPSRSVASAASSISESMNNSKRIVTYVNGERVETLVCS